VYSFLFKKVIKEKDFLPGYFFYGEETFLAFQFIQELQDSLVSPEAQEFNVEKFSLAESSWAEIIDSARTIPFFFSPWRLISVEIPEEKRNHLSANEESILKEYFSSPLAKTTLIIIYWGKIKKNDSLFKFISSLPPSLVYTKELKRLKDKSLYSWMERKLSSGGKRATLEAKKRLEEIKGSNLRSLDNELEKLMTFVDEKEVIELDDVNQVSGWAKTFYEWELSNSLERANYKQTLLVLNNLFKEGIKPEYVLGMIAKFFRDIFLAKLWLKERKKERKAIFRELRPHIQEKYGSFYSAKLREFFALVESIPQNVLNHILNELERIDFQIKTSSASSQILLENFLYDFCSFRKDGRFTWRKRC
jgi:DNA polymerase III delta subunit